MDEQTAQAILQAIQNMSSSIQSMNNQISQLGTNSNSSGINQMQTSEVNNSDTDDNKKESVLQAYLMQFKSDKVKNIIKSVSEHFDLDSLMNWMNGNRESLKGMDDEEANRELSKDEKIQRAMKNGDVEALKELLSDEQTDEEGNEESEDQSDDQEDNDEEESEEDDSDTSVSEQEDDRLEKEPNDTIDINKMIRRKNKPSKRPKGKRGNGKKTNIPKTPKDKDDDDINDRINDTRKKSRKIISYF